MDSSDQPSTNSISLKKSQNSEAMDFSPNFQKTQNSEVMAFSANNQKTQKSPLAKLYKKFSRKRSDPGIPPTQVDELSNGNFSSSNGSSEINVEELRVVFDYMDVNSDGRISAAELQSCVSLLGGALSACDAEEAVKMMDLDGDGSMDFGEFLKLMEGEGDNYGEEERRRELKEAFMMYVTESDEFITAASLRRMLSRLGESRTVDDCKAMIRAFDKNGDGVLSFDEFLLMMR